jgi:sugar lactone lactonase YvrE
MRSKILGGLLLFSALSLVASRSDAAGVATIVALDPAQGQLPESITIDDEGTVFLSMAPAAAVWKVIPDGDHAPVLLAALPVAAGALSTGVKIGKSGDAYVCTGASDPTLDASHVWRISQDGTIWDVSHLDANGFPNDLAFDDEGDLFVTDPKRGVVYRIDSEGHAEIWLSDPILMGNVVAPVLPGMPFGADGIAFDRHKRNLYIGNLDFGEILRVRVGHDGAPGELEVFASDPALVGADGIAFDREGDLYVAVNAQNQIVRIDGDGVLTTVARGAPLDNPSSLVFSPERGSRRTLYVASFAVSQALGIVPGPPQPSLDALEVPFAGLPLP